MANFDPVEPEAFRDELEALDTEVDGKADSGHGHALDDLSDVDTSGGSEDDVLTKQGDGSWAPAEISSEHPVVVGTYTGDGTDDREIDVGFEPALAEVFAGNGVFWTHDGSGGFRITTSATDTQSYPHISANGFTVDGAALGNANGTVYTYRVYR